MKITVRAPYLLSPLLALAGFLLTSEAAAQRALGCYPSGAVGNGWLEHLVDGSERCLMSSDGGGRDGADGVDVADFDNDGDLDVVTGWEESGEIIVAINPGTGFPGPTWDIATPWTKLNVDGGDRKQGLEDAVFVDFQDDNLPEVVSAAEGDVREVFLSGVSPAGGDRLDPDSWVARDMPGDGRFFMRVQAGDLDQDGDVDIVVGAKDSSANGIDIPAGIWWYENPSETNGWTPDQGVGSWNRRKIAGDIKWIMEMILEDMDGDGDLDVFFNDRRRVAWMRNPLVEGNNIRNEENWKKRIIENAGGALTGGVGAPYRWSHYINMDGDPAKELVVATNYGFDRGVVARWFDNDRVDTDPSDQNDTRWSVYEVAVAGGSFPVGEGLPFDEDGEGSQTSKAVAAHDLDGDGRAELVLTARGGENGTPGKGVGVYRLSYHPTLAGPPKCGNGTGQTPCTGVANTWQYAPIGPSYAEDMKYDNLKIFDADGDGDVDILTVEENVDGKGLGLVAYENVVPPYPGFDFASTTTGVPVVIDVAANDLDSNLDPCSVTVTTTPAQGGTATVAGCGLIQFTPNPSLPTHDDFFTYQICDTDPKTPCATASVAVYVENLGGITAGDDTVALQPRVISYVNVLANDTSTTPLVSSSVEVTSVGFGLSSCLVTANGLSGGPPPYLPDGRFELIPKIPCPFGSVGFDYRVCNEAGFCDTGHVTVQISLDTPSAPVAQDDYFEVSIADLDFFLFPNLELNDLDANCVSGFFCTGEAITIIEPPLYGTIIQTYPNIYRPTPGLELPPVPFDETFRYEICDFDDLCSQAQATIHVVPEPGTTALLAGGVALAALDRRRRRARSAG
jgi:hypothetical protein